MLACVLLHLRECCLAFGGCWPAYCSICETIVSLLEGLSSLSAPILRAFSRVWRVNFCVLLHLREVVLVIGVDSAFKRSNRENTLSCLEGLFPSYAPFARVLSRVWRVSLCVLLHLRDYCLVNGGGWFKSATIFAYCYANLL